MQNNLHYHQLYMPYRALCRVISILPNMGVGSHWPRQIHLCWGVLMLEARNLSQVTIMCKLHINGIGWHRLTQMKPFCSREWARQELELALASPLPTPHSLQPCLNKAGNPRGRPCIYAKFGLVANYQATTQAESATWADSTQ